MHRKPKFSKTLYHSGLFCGARQRLHRWLNELVNKIELVEYMIAWDEDKSESHKLMWTVWSHFRYSSEFDSFISTTVKLKQIYHAVSLSCKVAACTAKDQFAK